MHLHKLRGRRLPLAAALAAVTALIGVAAGCGASGTGDQGGDSKDVETLTVEVSTTSTDILNYIAQGKGFFKKEGVDVQVNGNAGTNAITLVSSGESDIAGYGGSTPLVVAGKGRPTSILYGITGGGVGSVVVSNPAKAKTVEDLQRRSSCRLGSFPEGSSSYGYAVLYVKNLNLNCEVVPFGDNSSLVGALSADKIDAMVGGYSNFAPAIDEKNLPVLVDSRQPEQREKYIGPDIVEVTFWATKDRVEEKHEAIVRWLRGIDQARAYVMDPANADEATQLLSKNKDFSGLTQQQIKSDVVETFHAYLPAGNEKGFIDEATWQRSVERYDLFGIPGFDSSDEHNQYGTAVDMGPLQEALGKKP